MRTHGLLLAALLLLAAAARAQPADPVVGASPSPDPAVGASPSPDPYPEPVKDPVVEEPQPSPSPSPDPYTFEASPSPDPWVEEPPTFEEEQPAFEEPAGEEPTYEEPTTDTTATDDTEWVDASPSPDPYAGTPDTLAEVFTQDPSTLPATPAVLTPSPAPVASPPPPPPAGLPLRLVLLMDDTALPLPDNAAAGIVQALNFVTAHTWTFREQQPFFGQLPQVPAEPAAAPAPAATIPAAAGAVPAATAPVSVLSMRVSVDPLPQNGLGGRRLRQAAVPVADLPLASTPGACWSTKHWLAPDKATCLAFCDAQLAAGKAAADAFKPTFYEENGNNCCRCEKKPTTGDAAANTTTTAGAATGAAAGGAAAAATPAAPATDAGYTRTPSPSPSPSPALPPVAAPAAPAASAANPTGVFVFAETLTANLADVAAVNRTLRGAIADGGLNQQLAAYAGVQAATLDVMFLGTGAYDFSGAVLPYKYVRPVARTAHTEAAEAETGSSGKGALIGIILGACCAAVAVVVVGGAIALRRHRAKKEVSGQALVRRWESERRAADDARRAAADARRAASQKQLDRVLARSAKEAAQPSSLDRMRSKLGLPPKDHLAAAAARVDKADAAAAAADKAKSRGSSSGGSGAVTLQATMPAEPAAAPAEELQTVVVRQAPSTPRAAGAPAPSWATRDPGQPERKRGFFTFGSKS